MLSCLGEIILLYASIAVLIYGTAYAGCVAFQEGIVVGILFVAFIKVACFCLSRFLSEENRYGLNFSLDCGLFMVFVLLISIQPITGILGICIFVLYKLNINSSTKSNTSTESPPAIQEPHIPPPRPSAETIAKTNLSFQNKTAPHFTSPPQNLHTPPHRPIIQTSPEYHFYRPHEIRSMSWKEFEKFIAKIFNENGFKATYTAPSNDGGKDVIAVKDNVTYFIECKHWQIDSYIGREPLQKLVGAALSKRVHNVIFITTGKYNENAIFYAEELNKTGLMKMQLWTMRDILNFANNAN